MSTNPKEIDFLFEDPPINNQKYALISIVGPHMPQKCNVWGLKIRGTAENLEKAKTMTKKLIKIDNNYDIYTVEVGKFFPINVEPTAVADVADVEYENENLNALVKSYLENRELANEHWNQRKNEMIKEAIREGKEQNNKQEHPIAVLQRIKHFQQQLEEMKNNMSALQEDLNLATDKFANYSEEEKTIAQKELENALNNNVKIEEVNEPSIEDIRKQIIQELSPESNPNQNNSQNFNSQGNIETILQEIKLLESEKQDLINTTQTMNNQISETTMKRLNDNIKSIESKISTLKQQLENSNEVNNFINSSYTESKYDYLESDPSISN
jgi:DNA repair exonuclease SbcCD ATPase subunit